MKKNTFLVLIFLTFSSLAYGQFGIRAGINTANEINSFTSQSITSQLNTKNLTGYKIGLIYQALPQKSGFGFGTGLLVSQKGYSFSDSTSVVNVLKTGYKEMNYLELPLNLKYRLSVGILGIIGTAGVYAGYALEGKTVVETDNTTVNVNFQNFMDHTDYGYNLGLGIEFFKKIELGVEWTQGLKTLSTSSTSLNKVYSFNLTYLF